MKVERTPVVAEASPPRRHRRRCGGARLRGRKAFEEPRQPTITRGPVLLEHRLRPPGPTTDLRATPRQVPEGQHPRETASRRASSFGSTTSPPTVGGAPADTNDSAIAQHDATHRQALTSAAMNAPTLPPPPPSPPWKPASTPRPVKPAMVDIDEHQVVAYDIAHGAAAVASARNPLGYGVHGEAEERLTVAFADVAHDLATRPSAGKDGVSSEARSTASTISWRPPSAELLALVGGRHHTLTRTCSSPRHLPSVADEIAPRAEHVHRTNADVPEELIEGLRSSGSRPAPVEYGGFAEGGVSTTPRHGRCHRGTLPRLARHRRSLDTWPEILLKP